MITSVDRDDLPDAGASMFAECIHQIRKRVPGCRIEVLIPDFGGMRESLQAVMDAGPDTLNHNIETVRAGCFRGSVPGVTTIYPWS